MPDDLILLCVPSVVCVLLPVFDVNVCDTPNKKFQFTFVEYVDEIWWDELVEAGNEGIELFFHSLLNSPFRDKPATGQQRPNEHDAFLKSVLDVFLFIFVGHFNVPSVRLQIDSLNLSKTLVFCRKCRLYNAFDVVFPAQFLAL